MDHRESRSGQLAFPQRPPFLVHEIAPQHAEWGPRWLTVLRAEAVALALVVPAIEELFWRSFLLGWLDAREFGTADPRRASPRAFALTAVRFASEYSHWLGGLIAGLLYNCIRTGNVWVPIASHAITTGALDIWVLATRYWHL